MSKKSYILYSIVTVLIVFGLGIGYTNRKQQTSFSGNDREFKRYYIQQNKIYYNAKLPGGEQITTLLTGADVKTFHALGGQGNDMYARDKSQVRYNNLFITGVDVSSFKMSGYFAFDKNKVYYVGIPLQVDRNTFWQTGEFYGDSQKIYIGTDIEYKPKDFKGNEIDINIGTFKRLSCKDGLTDQYDNPVEVYVDKNRLFFDSKGLGISILYGVGTGFDYDTIECNQDEILDKYGTYAIIHGKNFLKATLINRLIKKI